MFSDPRLMPLVILLAIRAILEERALADRFPEYAAYAQRTKYRFAPEVWKSYQVEALRQPAATACCSVQNQRLSRPLSIRTRSYVRSPGT